jgi:ankyrin repeat protein
VNLLLGYGIDLKVVNESGQTALHTACSRGFLIVAKALIEKEAGLTFVKDSKGSSPLLKYGSFNR